MDHRLKLNEIAAFLAPYKSLYQQEIMLIYPHALDDYPKEWIEELSQIKDQDQIIKLEKKEYQGIIKGQSLNEFYRRIEELSVCKSIPDLPPMSETAWTFLYTIPKKQHEIRKLAPLVNHLYQENKINHIVDIGGGIGLLAQTLNNKYHLNVTTVDMNPALQATGFNRHEGNAVSPDQKVKYVNLKVSHEEMEFTKLLDHKTMTIGLHTCGQLANEQILATVKNKVGSLVNFGCCYQTLTPINSQNLSDFAQNLEHKLHMNKFSLTLAARAHRKMNDEDFEFKIKVKYFRYVIHFLLHDEYDIRQMVSLGNSKAELYDESFGTYALEQLERLKIIPKHSKEELDLYFKDESRQELVWKMLAAGLIRNSLGRLLELYLLLDRVIYLEEQGYQVQLLEFFEEELSPRNLGIVATSD